MKKLMNGWMALSLVLLAGCAANVPPAVGVWDVEINTPLGVLSAEMTINGDGSGDLSSDALNAPIAGITFDGNTMAFDVEVNAQGQMLPLSFSGTVEGDSLTGEFDSDFGAFAVTGTRLAE